MPYKKAGDYIVEYKVIPQHDFIIRKLTPDQFIALEDKLKAEVVKDPKHATPASRPAGTYGELVKYGTGTALMLYFCVDATANATVWQKIAVL